MLVAGRKGPILTALCALAIFPPAASAAVINVNVVGPGSDESPPATDGDCTLREAIDAARLNVAVDSCTAGELASLDTINIPLGLVELAGAPGADDNAGGDLDVTGGGPLTIAGAGAGSTSVQAATGDRGFDLLAGTTTVSGIFGYGGTPTGEGGFARVAGSATLNVTGSSIDNNTAGGSAGRGGAISGATGSTISIDQSAIESNTAQAADGNAAGGGIFSDGVLAITDSDINANQATGGNVGSDGGGVAATGTTPDGPAATISGSRILSNSTTVGRFGGGIYLGKGFQTEDYEISDTTIQGNTAPFSGGGIAILASNSLAVDGSVIEDNHMPGSGVGGAGIAAGQNNATDKVVITDSSLVGNDITGTDSGNGLGGAAIRTTQGELTIKRSLISDNDITTASPAIIGGGIRTISGTVTIENSTLFGNDIFAGADNAAGAALGITGGGTGHFVHTTIAGHILNGSGAAVFAANPGSVELDGSLVEGDCVTSTTSPISSASAFNLLADTTCNQGSNNTQVTPSGLGLAGAPAPNGGPTDTMALVPPMPARDLVPRGACDNLDGGALTTDQRGVPRPYGKACDAGAYEFSKCGGAVVNVVGGKASESLKGGPGDDGILGLGGKDVLKGKGGTDGLCGGKGNDKLVGGPGGGDLCDGGPGRDHATGSCERKRAVP